MSQITGSCLCGEIKYTLHQNIGDIMHCHCIKCRKAHGSAFSSVAKIDDKNFNLTDDSYKLKSYPSSENKYRHFCSNCGSQIYAKRDNTDFIILRLGTLNNETLANNDYRESKHIWLSEKACWYELNNKIEEQEKF
jgi:hypothetical protein